MSNARLKFCFLGKFENFLAAPSFKICPRNSPNLANCIKSSIEILRPHLKTGDFGNGFKIDSLEPITIDDILLERGQGFYFNLMNVKAFKISNFHVEKLRVNVNSFYIDAIVNIPNVEAVGDYKLNLLIALANIKGEGRFKCLIGKKHFSLLYYFLKNFIIHRNR